MIGMLYGSGLRVSEVCSIRVKDLDFIGLRLKIRDSKGNKDRITLLSSELVSDLLIITKDKIGEDYLFLTQSGSKYSVRTVQKVFTRALEKSKVRKSPTCHTLRHAFATHLVENGVDIKTVKQLLGHKSIKTTMIYIKLADVRTRDLVSPL
jgi:site-specific recombinase XerD